MSKERIKESVSDIWESLPAEVEWMAAAKTRTPEEVQAGRNAGIKNIRYNYV